jgi:hypothetical protein
MLSQLTLIMFLGLSGFGHSPSDGQTRHVNGWTVRADSDRFTGQMICHLSRGRVGYEKQALVLHLPSHIDTSNAVYRIDGGQPDWVRDDEMELARLGFALHDDNLNNPSGGLVRIPERRVGSASAVSIETVTNRRPITVNIDGFAPALEAASKAGCAPADFR